MTGTLDDSPLAEKVWQLLPFECFGETWGQEVYFPVRLQTENTEPVKQVKKGDIAYWPDGPDLCIFFGPTPKSTNEEPVTASPVTVIGSFDCDPQNFHLIERQRRGVQVRVERSETGVSSPTPEQDQPEAGEPPAESGQ